MNQKFQGSPNAVSNGSMDKIFIENILTLYAKKMKDFKTYKHTILISLNGFIISWILLQIFTSWQMFHVSMR